MLNAKKKFFNELATNFSLSHLSPLFRSLNPRFLFLPHLLIAQADAQPQSGGSMLPFTFFEQFALLKRAAHSIDRRSSAFLLRRVAVDRVSDKSCNRIFL